MYNSADAQVCEERVGEGAPGTGADSPVAHDEDNDEAGCDPAAIGGPQQNRYPFHSP